MFSNPMMNNIKQSSDDDLAEQKNILEDTQEQSHELSRAEDYESNPKQTFSNPFKSTFNSQEKNHNGNVGIEIQQEKRMSVKDLIGNFGGNKNNVVKNSYKSIESSERENIKDMNNFSNNNPRGSLVNQMVKGIEKKVLENDEKRMRDNEFLNKFKEIKRETTEVRQKEPDIEKIISEKDLSGQINYQTSQNLTTEVLSNKPKISDPLQDLQDERFSIRPTADFGVKPIQLEFNKTDKLEENQEESEEYSKILDVSVDPENANNVSMMKPIMNNPLEPNKSLLDASMNQSELNISRLREPFNPFKVGQKPWEMNFDHEEIGNEDQIQLNLINLESHLLSQRTEDTKDLTHMSLPKFKNQFYQRDNSFYLNMSQMNQSHIANKSINKSMNKSMNKSVNKSNNKSIIQNDVDKEQKIGNILDSLKNETDYLGYDETKPRETAQFGALEDMKAFISDKIEFHQENFQIETPKVDEFKDHYLKSTNLHQNLSQLEISKISQLQENFMENDDFHINTSTQQIKLLMSPHIQHPTDYHEEKSNNTEKIQHVEKLIHEYIIKDENKGILSENKNEIIRERDAEDLSLSPKIEKDDNDENESEIQNEDLFKYQFAEEKYITSKIQNENEIIQKNENSFNEVQKKIEQEHIQKNEELVNSIIPGENLIEETKTNKIDPFLSKESENLVQSEACNLKDGNLEKELPLEERYTFSGDIFYNKKKEGNHYENTDKEIKAIHNELISDSNEQNDCSDLEVLSKKNEDYENNKLGSSNSSDKLEEYKKIYEKYQAFDTNKLVNKIFEEAKKSSSLYVPEQISKDIDLVQEKEKEELINVESKEIVTIDAIPENTKKSGFERVTSETNYISKYTNPFSTPINQTEDNNSIDTPLIENNLSKQEDSSIKEYPQLESEIYKKYLSSNNFDSTNYEKKAEIKMSLKFKKKNRVRPQIQSPKSTIQLPLDKSFDLNMTIGDEAKPNIFIPVESYNSNNEIFQRKVFGFQVKKEKFIRGVDQLKIDRDEIEIICINCQELISLEEADSHSRFCYLQQPKARMDTTFTLCGLKEINQKIELLSNKIELKINLLSINDKLAIQDISLTIKSLIQENSDDLMIEGMIQRLLKNVEIIEGFTSCALQISILILTNRLVLLAKEKISEIQLGEFEDIELVNLQHQISNYERETLKQKAELELWKYQADMLHEIKLNDEKNLKYVKTQYRKDFEMLSQIQSDIDYSDGESSCAGTSVTSATPLQFENNFMIKSSAENAENEKIKIKFYSTAVNAKLNLPPGHHGKDLLISDLYEKSQKLKLTQELWEDFLKKEFETYN